MENQKECCAKFNPEIWDNKTIEWTDKLFIREDLPQIFHMPLPWTIGGVMTKLWKKIQDAGANPEIKDFIWLCYDPSPWKSENYIAVTKEVSGLRNEKISGTFMTKVFDGPYNEVPKWIKEMDRFLSGQGKKAEKYYFYYTTCPKCAKKYGHNYVVLFAKI
jgi:hypothetical protein